MTHADHAEASPSFRLLTLGGLSLVDPSGATLGPQPRRLALLALLSSAPATGISRDRLMACLSPESTTESARHSLHQLLYYLRQQTSDDVFLGTDPLRLNPLVIASDRADFDAAVEQGDRAKAARLYRGPFLDGFHLNSAGFEEWAEAERSRLAATHGDVLLQLATEAQAAGDLDGAIAWGRQLARLDPLSSRVALALMRSLVTAGDTPGALRHAKQHEMLVRAELGTQGDAQVSAFVAALQAGSADGSVADVVAAQDGVRHRPTAHEPAARTPIAADTLAPAPRRPTVRSTVMATALGSALVLAIAAAVVRQRAPVNTSPGVIAVLPFRVSATDSTHEWLRDGMVELLTARLYGDGRGAARLADAGVVLRIWQRENAGSSRETRDVALRVATALNATRIIDGSVTTTASRVVLTASILSMPGFRVAARESVEGPSDSALVLVDRLAARLLGLTAGVERERLGALTSTSLRAVRAYLAGRAAWRSGNAERAAVAFREAVAQDSSFALANLALARTMLVVGGSVQDFDRLRNLAIANQEQLMGADRALLRVMRATWDSWPEMFAEWNAAAGAFPDLPEAWYGLGKAFLRYGALAGLDSALQRADDAFRRGVRLDSIATGAVAPGPPNPFFVEEFLRMVEYAHMRGDTVEVRRLVSRARPSDSTSAQAQALEWHLAAVEGDMSRSAFWKRIESVDQRGFQFIRMFITWTGVGAEDFERVESEDERRLRSEDVGGIANAVRIARALNGGRPRDALRVDPARGSVPRGGARFQIVQALSWEGDTAVARAAVESLRRSADAPPATGLEGLAQHLDVCAVTRWRLRNSDPAGAEAASKRLRVSKLHGLVGFNTPAFERVLRVCAALIDAEHASLLARSDAKALLVIADSLVRTFALANDAVADANLALARLWETQGDLPRALAAARRRAGTYADWPPCLSSFVREEGRLAALTGDRAGAIRAYRHYLMFRYDPEPSAQPEVERVRRELAAIEGRR